MTVSEYNKMKEVDNLETELGYLIVNVYVDNIAQPIQRAKIEVLDENIIVYTNKDGASPKINLTAPSSTYSQTPNSNVKPYATYNIRVSKNGLVPMTIENVQIFPGITSTQNVFLTSISETEASEETEVIDDITLWEENSSSLNNNNNNIDNSNNNLKTRVLPYTFIPEYIIVHDGIPSNTNAANYYVSFPDYIKNVASSEIYSTWPKETIKANVHAIVSFALNRIYTEYYPSRGYNFTITSTSTYDQKYTRNRTIFDTISNVVDDYFNTYIKVGNNNYPLLAQYNDGINNNVKGRLSQWGSKNLGDKGYNAIAILRYYYGNNINLENAPLRENFPTSFPGYNLTLNSCGGEVQVLQNELNIIRSSYPKIPIIKDPSGIYNEATKNAVKTFQQVFSLPQTGIIDFATWYKISYVYTAVSNMTKGIFE